MVWLTPRKRIPLLPPPSLSVIRIRSDFGTKRQQGPDLSQQSREMQNDSRYEAPAGQTTLGRGRPGLASSAPRFPRRQHLSLQMLPAQPRVPRDLLLN